ncbi:MAG: zf-HC2 domain-containing protein [Leucobacter sp.]
MSDCGCEKARANLEEVIRGELCAADSAPIREHLANCEDCRDEEQVFHRLTEAVRRACAAPAPPSLREAVMNGLRELHTE